MLASPSDALDGSAGDGGTVDGASIDAVAPGEGGAGGACDPGFAQLIGDGFSESTAIGWQPFYFQPGTGSVAIDTNAKRLLLQRDTGFGTLLERSTPLEAVGIKELELRFRVDLETFGGYTFAFAQVGTLITDAPIVRLVANAVGPAQGKIFVEQRVGSITQQISKTFERPASGWIDASLRIRTDVPRQLTVRIGADSEILGAHPIDFDGSLMLYLASFVDPPTQPDGPVKVYFDDVFLCARY